LRGSVGHASRYPLFLDILHATRNLDFQKPSVCKISVEGHQKLTQEFPMFERFCGDADFGVELINSKLNAASKELDDILDRIIKRKDRHLVVHPTPEDKARVEELATCTFSVTFTGYDPESSHDTNFYVVASSEQAESASWNTFYVSNTVRSKAKRVMDLFNIVSPSSCDKQIIDTIEECKAIKPRR
jgi:hypothetical protein